MMLQNDGNKSCNSVVSISVRRKGMLEERNFSCHRVEVALQTIHLEMVTAPERCACFAG